MKKLAFDDVKKVFEDAGCVLVGPYVNVRTKLKYKCSCGREAEIFFPNFQRGQRCMECSGNKRFSFEYVKKYFEENDCKLLESQYKNNKSSLNYICSCGNATITTFDSFKNNGARCMSCSGSAKYEFEYVKKYFEDSGCELLEEEYKNSHASMRYVCSCGNMSATSFTHFLNNVRCVECGEESKRFSLEEVQTYFEKNGCELLEKKYKNCLAKMKYICSCGEESFISFSSFKSGSRCMDCANEDRKHSLEYVKKKFEENNCVLLEKTYNNVNAKMRYICSCGVESTVCFTSFHRGVRCKGCGHDKAATSSFTFKDYTCPDGEVVRYQGYENLALDELYSSYTQSDIENSRRNMPVINYEFKGKICRYYPDIFIKSENKIIEVKSRFTYNLYLVKNILKGLATRKAGFDYEVWFYTPLRQGNFIKEII